MVAQTCASRGRLHPFGKWQNAMDETTRKQTGRVMARNIDRLHVQTGVSGQDVIEVTIIHGAGKTILGKRPCFSHAKGQGRARYVAPIAPTRRWMLMHLSNMHVFDPDAIPGGSSHNGAVPMLGRTDLTGLPAVLHREVRRKDGTLPVLDPLVAAERRAGSSIEL